MLPPTEGDASAEKPDDDDDVGLPADHLLPVLECILNEIMDLRDAIEVSETRMVGSSLLVAYEADAKRLRNVLFEADDEDDNTRRKEKETEKDLISALDETRSRKKMKVDDDDENINNHDDDDDDESSTTEETPPFVVRLIDFAHTRLADGQGPDLGVLKGLDTVIKLLRGRIKEVEKILEEDEEA